MQLQIGTSPYVYTVIPVIPVLSLDGGGGPTYNITDDHNAWGHWYAQYTVPLGQTATTFSFAAISTGSAPPECGPGGLGCGNFLDSVVFTPLDCVPSPPPSPMPPSPPFPPPGPSTSMCPALFGGLVAYTSVVSYQIRVVNLALGNAAQTGMGPT